MFNVQNAIVINLNKLLIVLINKYLIMRISKHILFILLIVILVSCSQNMTPQGHYQSTQIVVDGNTNDWTLPLRLSNKDYTLSYNISNDNNNIYIIVMSKDEHIQQRILKSGLTIYFDPKGENNKTISLTYPEKKTSSNSNGNPTNYDSLSKVNTLNLLVLNSDAYDAEGFYTVENGQYAVNDKKNKIRMALKASIDSGLVYEIAIPISYVLENGLTAKALKKTFSIGINVHPDASSARRSNNNNQDGNNNSGFRPSMRMGGGFGGMGMGGGMRGGGGRRQGNSQQDSQPAEEKLWYQFRFPTQANQ